jgi:hypothetical protein
MWNEMILPRQLPKSDLIKNSMHLSDFIFLFIITDFYLHQQLTFDKKAFCKN